MKLLLEHGADVHAENKNLAYTAFIVASGFIYDPRVMHLLVTNGLKITTRIMRDLVHYRPLETIQIALGRVEEHDMQENGFSWLWCAVERNEREVFDLILPVTERYNTLSTRNPVGEMVLFEALRGRYEKNAHLAWSLIAAGVDLDAVRRLEEGEKGDGRSALHMAFYGGYLDVAKELINKGCRLDIVDQGGLAGLHLAVNAGSMDLIRLWFARGADINLHIHTPFTATETRIQFSREGWGDIRDCTPIEFSGTALHCAVLQKDAKMVQAILTLGSRRPNLTIRDEDGRTPVELAEMLGQKKLVNMLVSSLVGL